MRIAVASRNPIKVAATRAAFAALFEGAAIECVPRAIASGVADQPWGDEETRRGARTRALGAFAAVSDAEFAVGLEGGVEAVDQRLICFAWAAVTDRSGEVVLVRSVSLPLPDAVRTLVDDGVELGAANDRVFATVNSKQAGGAFGLLTRGRYTRESVYAETVTMALLPFANPIYRAHLD